MLYYPTLSLVSLAVYTINISVSPCMYVTSLRRDSFLENPNINSLNWFPKDKFSSEILTATG